MALPTGACPSFLRLKRQGVSLLLPLPPHGMPVHHEVTPQQMTIHRILLGGERHGVRVKCLSQKHNSVTQPGLEPRPLDPQTSAMFISPPCLPFMMKMNSMCFAVYHFIQNIDSWLLNSHDVASVLRTLTSPNISLLP